MVRRIFFALQYLGVVVQGAAFAKRGSDRCGSVAGGLSCVKSGYGDCCSKYNYCGSTSDYCSLSNGCQSGYGTCAGSSIQLNVSKNSRCGKDYKQTCQGSTFGNCCSQHGYCGSTKAYCANGCQSGFGSCTNGASSSQVVSVSSSRTMLSNPVSTQTISKTGRCGAQFGEQTCKGSTYGNCCSQYFYCGSADGYCSPASCQKGYGDCNLVTSSSSLASGTTLSSRVSSHSSSSSIYSSRLSSTVSSSRSSSSSVSSSRLTTSLPSSAASFTILSSSVVSTTTLSQTSSIQFSSSQSGPSSSDIPSSRSVSSTNTVSFSISLVSNTVTSSSTNTFSSTVTSSIVIPPSSTDASSSVIKPSSTNMPASTPISSSPATVSSVIISSSTDISSSTIAPSSTDISSSTIAPSSTDISSSTIAPSSTDISSSTIAPSSTDVSSSIIPPSSTVTSSNTVVSSGSAIATTSSATPPVPSIVQIVANPSFELGTGTQAIGWTLINLENTDIQSSGRFQGRARTGAFSFRSVSVIVEDSDFGPTGTRYIYDLSQTVTVVRGASYTVQILARTNDSCDIAILVDNVVVASLLSPTDTYMAFSRRITIANNARLQQVLRIRPTCGGALPDGTLAEFFIDDVTMTLIT